MNFNLRFLVPLLILYFFFALDGVTPTENIALYYEQFDLPIPSATDPDRLGWNSMSTLQNNAGYHARTICPFSLKKWAYGCGRSKQLMPYDHLDGLQVREDRASHLSDVAEC